MRKAPSRYDIVVTWPKKRSLESYLAELRKAEALELVINYRVPRLPEWPDASAGSWPMPRKGERRPRCYQVHDGAVRGFCEVLAAAYRREGTVYAGSLDRWPAGLYVVRAPTWYPIKPIPMPGFRSWRWFEPPVSAWRHKEEQ